MYGAHLEEDSVALASTVFNPLWLNSNHYKLQKAAGDKREQLRRNNLSKIPARFDKEFRPNISDF